MDLAKTAEVKAALQEAIDAAAQQAEATKAEANTDSPDQQAAAQDTLSHQHQQADTTSETEAADMIGPQIRPQTGPQIGPPEQPLPEQAVSPAQPSSSQPSLEQDGSSQEQIKTGVAHSTDSQSALDRPSKKQKVALSFADDESDH